MEKIKVRSWIAAAAAGAMGGNLPSSDEEPLIIRSRWGSCWQQ